MVIKPEWLFIVGNLLSFLSSAPMAMAVYKDRTSLGGFSRTGAIMTAGCMVCMVGGFWVMGTYLTVALAIPTTLFWCIVVYFKLKG